jgi:mono/diheme cytochrome c family protein
VGLVLIAGCRENYPEDLRFPVRTDPLVTKTPDPKTPPRAFDKPGEFLHLLEDPSDPLLGLKEGRVYLVLFPATDPRSGKVGISDETRDKMGDALDALFGTPREPMVLGIDRPTRKTLRLDQDTLARGSKLFRLHCVHCHGLSGDGRGPTAPWVNPHPRDYRRGIFKFTSSSQGPGERKPLRSDLLRTLRQGIEGTSMPAFRELPDEDLQALISYVIHLSLRGQVEFETMEDMIARKTRVKNFGSYFRVKIKDIASFWVKANNEKIKPGTDVKLYPVLVEEKGGKFTQVDVKARKKRDIDRLMRASVHAGQRTFKSLCITCHFDYGRQPNLVYDAWGTIVRPANLTTGVYRGGRRPIDLYYRLHSGINGANMAKLEGNQQAEGMAYEKKIWDLINFLTILPYPEMRKKNGIEIN